MKKIANTLVTTKENYIFPDFINTSNYLIALGYSIWYSKLKYKTVYIIFNSVYTFKTIPNGFNIMNKKLGNCSDCANRCTYQPNFPYIDMDCINSTGYKTILIYENSILSESQLSEIIKDLTTWASELEKVESDE